MHFPVFLWKSPFLSFLVHLVMIAQQMMFLVSIVFLCQARMKFLGIFLVVFTALFVQLDARYLRSAVSGRLIDVHLYKHIEVYLDHSSDCNSKWIFPANKKACLNFF